MKVKNKAEALNLFKKNSNKIQELGVEKVGIFGSFVEGKQLQNSDVDLLVEFKKGDKTYRNFIEFAEFAEKLLGRKVDLLTPESMSPYIAPYINKEIEYVQITN